MTPLSPGYHRYSGSPLTLTLTQLCCYRNMAVLRCVSCVVGIVCFVVLCSVGTSLGNRIENRKITQLFKSNDIGHVHILSRCYCRCSEMRVSEKLVQLIVLPQNIFYQGVRQNLNLRYLHIYNFIILQYTEGFMFKLINFNLRIGFSRKFPTSYSLQGLNWSIVQLHVERKAMKAIMGKYLNLEHMNI